MGAWPVAPEFPAAEVIAFTPFGPHSLIAAGLLPAGLASAVWPVANKALFVPVRLSRALRLTRLFLHNGATASGNFDVGIYDRNGNRLVSTGSTAQVGTSVLQIVTLGTPFLLDRGLYYLAAAMDNTTGTTNRASVSTVLFAQAAAMAEMASAFPLPTTATLASLVAGYIPDMGGFARPSP